MQTEFQAMEGRRQPRSTWEVTVSADGPVSSTAEEPPPDTGARSDQWSTIKVIDAADDASHPAPDTVNSRSGSRSSFSPSDSSYSSVSCGDQFEASYRLFPPLLPSTNRQDRHLAAPSLAARLAGLADRTPAAALSVSASTSAADDSSSGEEGESDGEEDDGNEDDGDSVEDDGSEVEDDDDDARVQALWTRLRDQRDVVRQLRRELSDKRKRLRELRKKKDEADNRFMGIVRPYLVAGLRSPANSILRQFETMQRESNEYHEEEAEVEQLETELDEEELSREILETQFFSILYGASGGSGHEAHSPARSVADSYAPPSRASLLGISADRPVDIHPLYRQLLDAIGDRELAKEHHTELMMHCDSILYQLQLTIKRERLRAAEGRPDKSDALPDSADLELLTASADNPAGLDGLQAKYRTKIGEEEAEFLREFPKEEAMVREKLEETEAEVGRLRQLCVDKGVMRKNAPYYEEYIVFSGSGEPFSAGTMSISQEQAPRREEALAGTRFPILLSNPRHVLEDDFPLTPRGALRAATRLPHDDPERPRLIAEAMKEYGISTLVVESVAEDKSDFINRWLLHRLRVSPLEVELLYTIFSTKLKVKNMRRWQEDVLYYWSRDGANKPKEEYDGVATTRDILSIDDDATSAEVNSALDVHDRPESDPGDNSKPARRHHRSRSLRSTG